MTGAARLGLVLAALGWLGGCAGDGWPPPGERPFNHVFDCHHANAADDPRCGPFLRN
jgi:hypothetical protein